MRFLCTGDWHLRTDNPICRTDDFWETQKRCLKELTDIYKENNCDAILNSGDTLDKAKPDRAQELENLIYDMFKDIPVYFVMGNHDLLYHKLENADFGSIGVVSRFENWYYDYQEDNCGYYSVNNNSVYLFDFGREMKEPFPPRNNCFCLFHKYISKKEVLFFIKDGLTAEELLDTYPDYDVFITGDNHQGFVFEKDGRYVINPGRLNRQEADTKIYKPRVYILDTEAKTVEEIFLKADSDLEAVTEEYIIKQEQRDERISAFVESIKTGENISISFKDNMKKAIRESELDEGTKNMIEEIMEVCK